MRHIDELPEMDFDDPQYQSHPFETLAESARRWKIARSDRGVEILDYDLCRKAIVDRRLGTGHPKLMDVLGLPEGRALDYKRNSISCHNRGQRRRDLRVPVTKLMGPDASERFRTDIRHVITRVIDAIPTQSPVDLITQLCDPIPSAVYCYWTGAPFEDAGYVAKTSHTVQQVHTRNPDHTADIVAGFEGLLDFVDERIRQRRANMSDDLLSDLIRATDAGQLSEADLRNWVVKLAEANTDNSSHQIAIALIELASRPEVWARLNADPSLIPAAIREVMRFHPRSISTSREVMEDMVLEDTMLPKGTPVFANIGAAHWDARHYSDPSQFDIDRTDEPPHLNFGGGIFSCVGRFAVTMEIEEVIALLVRRHPNLKLSKAAFNHSPMFTSVAELEVVLDA
ncbi:MULTISPECIES: cytochrome P450 [Roseobacteraceae]|uniref:cytochrome P450 n=1 Tax=Roseobacteraceae TaxID=2854170 RepID=UPI0032970A2E